jgi:hypothetical protein
MLTGCSTAREAGCGALKKGFVAPEAEEGESARECAMTARKRKQED